MIDTNDVILSKIVLTETDLSEYWGIARQTLRKWRSTGEGPIYFKVGGRVLYPRRGVWEYEKSRTFRSTSCRIQKEDGGSNGQ